MGYGETLSASDKDLMCDFRFMSMGRVLPKDSWPNHTIPQGVSVFLRHTTGIFEYMFTKDDKYSGKVDYRTDSNEVQQLLVQYTPADYVGVVLYMNEDALKIASKHMKHAY